MVKFSSFAVWFTFACIAVPSSSHVWKRNLAVDVDGTNDEMISNEAEDRRTLARFTKGTAENEFCWDRKGVDGFVSPVDVHNHFQPFDGPNVPFELYADWVIEHGILFTTMMGLGQRIIKANADDPNCCYYLHCATSNYTVTPSDVSDRLNAEWFTNTYLAEDSPYADKLKIFLSATYPNLQVPDNNTGILDQLNADFPNAFSWVGEINLMKHALAANGFFDKPTVQEADFAEGKPLHDFFTTISGNGWPTTVHADMGCDNFFSVPGWDGKCIVQDPDQAAADFEWYQDFLGPHYSGFFDAATNEPKQNFRKIQYVKLFDALMTAFPNLKVTWAHMGLSKELLRLHPIVHSHIMKTMFARHTNLYVDISWDIIAQLYFMNYVGMSLEELQASAHEDMTEDSEIGFNSTYIEELRETLFKEWEHHDETIDEWGSAAKIDGPTHSMAIYYEILTKHSERFLTGTDFVASMGTPEDWPGLSQFRDPAVGCMKDKVNHARQVTDTSSINVVLSDEAFRNIVLGQNFFRLTGTDDIYQAPPVCQEDDSTDPKTKEEKETSGSSSLQNLAVVSSLIVGFTNTLAGSF